MHLFPENERKGHTSWWCLALCALFLSVACSVGGVITIFEDGVNQDADPLISVFPGGVFDDNGGAVADAVTNLFLWTFFSNADPTPDATENGNDGELFNTPTYVTNVVSISSHYSFLAASTEYINITNNITEFPDSLPVTYVAWIKIPDTVKKQIIFMGDTASNGLDNITLTVNADETVSMVITEAGTAAEATGTSDLGDDIWHHVVGVISNDGTAQIFIDSALEDTDVTGFSFPLGMDSIDVGRKGDSGPSQYFEGEIARPQILKVAWTPADVLSDFNNTKTNKGFLAVGADTNLPRMAWIQEYGSFGLVADGTGNGHNGVIVAGAAFAVNTNGSILTGVSEFDGSDDRLALGVVNSSNMFFGIGPFSISLWVRPNDTTSVAYVEYDVDSPGPFSLHQDSTGKLNWRIFASDNKRIGRAVSNGGISTSKWQNIVVTSTGGTSSSDLKIYINGAQKDDADDENLPFSGIEDGTGAQISLGVQNQAFLDYSGFMDRFIVYPSELSAEAVTNLFDDLKGTYL